MNQKLFRRAVRSTVKRFKSEFQEEQKPRSRHEKLFINVGSAALTGGFFGLLSAGAVLKQRKFLNLKSFKHPVKRSEIITAIVNNCRLRSGQFGSFGESFHVQKLSKIHIFHGAQPRSAGTSDLSQ